MTMTMAIVGHTPTETGWYWAQHDRSFEFHIVCVAECGTPFKPLLEVFEIGREGHRPLSEFVWGPGPLPQFEATQS